MKYWRRTRAGWMERSGAAACPVEIGEPARARSALRADLHLFVLRFMAEREGFELFDFTVLDIYRITPMKAIDSAGSCMVVFEYLSVRSLLIPPQAPPQTRALPN